MMILFFVLASSLYAQTPYRLTLDNVSMVNMKILDSAIDLDVHTNSSSAGIPGVEIRFSRAGHKPASEILNHLEISHVNSQKLIVSAPDEVTIQILFPFIANYHNRMMIRSRDGSPLRDLFNRLHGGKVVILTMSRPYNSPCPSELTTHRYDEFH